jgi:gas vesicle protein
MVINHSITNINKELPMSDEKGKGLLIGFLSGAIVGGILALLYAPKSGKELRHEIKTRSGEISDDVQDYLKDVQVKAKDVITESREKSASLISEAKQKAESLLRDAESLLSDAKRRVTDEGAKLKTAFRSGVDAFKDEKDSTESL